jgi:hypothetical protein
MIDTDGLAAQAAPTCTQLLGDFPELSIACVGAVGTGRFAGVFGDASGAQIQFIEKPLSVWSVEEALNKLVGDANGQLGRDGGEEIPSIELAAP